MTKLTETQTIILSAGAQRPDNIALPLPKGLAGAAAKMAVNRMIELGWLQEVDANLRRGEPLWRETGDGHGTTLVVTDAGLLAIGIEPVVVQTMTAIHNDCYEDAEAADPTRRDEAGDADRDAAGIHRRDDGRDRRGDGVAGPQRPWCDVRGAGQEARADRDLGQGGGQGAGLSDRLASTLTWLAGRSELSRR